MESWLSRTCRLHFSVAVDFIRYASPEEEGETTEEVSEGWLCPDACSVLILVHVYIHSVGCPTSQCLSAHI